MTAPRRAAARTYTPAEYLAFEEAVVDRPRHEYVDGHIYAMSGASTPHVILRDNLLVALHVRLRGGACRPFSGDLRVRAPDAQFYSYPDIAVVCGRMEVDEGKTATLLNPTLLIEVLSDSTEAYDRGEKFARYQAIPALREYVLVSQHEVRAESFVRGAGGAWTMTAAAGLDAVLALASVGCAVPLAELYEGVELSPRPRRLRRIREPAAPRYAAEGAR